MGDGRATADQGWKGAGREPAILEARALTVRYLPREGRERLGVEAVRKVGLELRPGESVGLVGPSGSGKSSLVLALSALLEPSAGEVLFDGSPVSDLDRARMLGFRLAVQPVLQATMGPLNPRQTVRGAVAEPMHVHGIAPSLHGAESMEGAVDNLLRQVGLSPDLAGRLPGELSGGERRRVAIARALALRPRVLLLDEPVSAVDVSVQAGILRMLEDLRSRLGLAYLLVSHDLGVVSQVCGRVLVMLDGSVVEAGPSSALFSNPLHPMTALLIRSRGEERDGSDGSLSMGTSRPEGRSRASLERVGNSFGGCPFHPHCTHPGKSDRCAVERPGLEEAPGDRFVACFGAFSDSPGGLDTPAG